MVKRGLLLVLFALFTVALAQNATYSNATARFAVDYPSDWVMREGVFGTTVMVVRPNPNGFSSNFNVVVLRVPAGTTLEATEDGLIEQLEAIITDFKLVAKQPATLAGQPAISVLYTGRQGKFNLVWYQVLTVRGTFAYAVTFTAEASAYESERTPFGNVLGSFRFL
jgi:hypothetical protein